MSSVQVIPPIPSFLDVDGSPLEDGYIFVGVADQNPESSPVSAFWDIGLTVPATQPIRTRGGFPSNGGQPSKFYVGDVTYSVIVKNKNGTPVHSVANSMSATDLEVRLADEVDSDNGSGLVGFIQDGISAVGMTAREKMKERVSILDFMTDAERADTLLSAPTLNHSSAFQKAIDYVTNTGSPTSIRGRKLIVPGGRRYRLGTSITVRHGGNLIGEAESLSDNYSIAQPVSWSIIYLDPGVTINGQIGTTFRGLAILPTGINASQTAAQVAAWAGTAITLSHFCVNIEKCLIAGFNLGVSAIADCSRLRMTDVLMDNKNCVINSGSFDVSYFTRVHCWPYLSVATGNPADYIRPGTAIKLKDIADWAKLTDCFTYAYARGYSFENVGACTAVSCSADGVAGTVGLIGFEFLGTTTGEIRLIAPQAAGQQIGIFINSSHTAPTANSIYIENPNIWTCVSRCIQIDSATDVHIRGGKLRNAPAGITLNNSGCSGSITSVNFTSDITGDCIQYLASSANWKTEKCLKQDGGTGRMETVGRTINNAASAATFVPHQHRDFMAVTGTTNITAIDATNSNVGRRILLRFTAGLTVTHSANLVLKGGVNQAVVAGNIMEFAYNGNNIWYETGARNF